MSRPAAPIARVTPREIAEMIVNEQAYADTRFVLATEHDAEMARLRAAVELSNLLKQPGALTVNCVRGTVTCQEAERLRARIKVLEFACRLIQEDPDPQAVVECSRCYSHQRLAFHALEPMP